MIAVHCVLSLAGDTQRNKTQILPSESLNLAAGLRNVPTLLESITESEVLYKSSTEYYRSSEEN